MVTTATELEAAITNFIKALQSGITVEAVVLYGSYAHGSPHQWSDIDVAVISPDFEAVAQWRRQEIIATLTLNRDRRLAPIGCSSSEYQNPRPHSFLAEIMRTGRVVYPLV